MRAATAMALGGAAAHAKCLADQEERRMEQLMAIMIEMQWEDCMPEGLICCDVTACKTKVIPREYGFIAQLNEGINLKKRPIEFQVDQIFQRFDENKLSFTKVGQEELLFQFE